MRPESHGGNKATILHESFAAKARLNLNDLLQKRQQEKDIDKKNRSESILKISNKIREDDINSCSNIGEITD